MDENQMSARTDYKSRSEMLTHRENRLRKISKLQTMEALIETWEKSELDSKARRQYLRELKARCRSVRQQFDAMKF